MINKAYELLKITNNEKAKQTFQRCVNYSMQSLDKLYLANLEGLVSQMGATDLGEADAIDLREKLHFIVKTVIEQDEKKLSLFEQYYPTPNVSTAKTIAASDYKFAEPVKGVDEIKTVKKGEYRFTNDGIYGGL